MADFPAVIDVGAMGAATGFRIDGPEPGSYFGWSAASAGDVNGDGLLDFVIGSRTADAPGVNSGAAYVVYGTTAGFPLDFDLATLDGSNGFVILGAPAGAGLGFGVAGTDIDGDGYSDLILGAAFADPNQGGAIYVVYGQASGFGASVDVGTAGAGAVSRLDGEGVNDRIGMKVSALGDFNGDGWGDFVVASSGAYRQGANNSGVAYVVFGDADGLPATVNLSALDGSNGFELFGAGSRAGLGSAVSGLDFNGDGFTDLMISAPAATFNTYYGARAYAGAVYVIYGTATPPASLDLAGVNGGNGFKLAGRDFASVGFWASGGGDFNDDGRDEVIFYNDGRIQVLYGTTGQPATTDLFYGMGPGFTLTGAGGQPTVHGGGDIDGDGFDDLVVADSTLGGGRGGAYVIFGGEALSGSHDLEALVTAGRAFRIDGPAGATGFGSVASFIGDINGDGADELSFGAIFASNAGSDSGSSYIIWGIPSEIIRAGTAGDETLSGGGLDDQLSGLGGQDRLSGLASDDALDGGDDRDLLYGGAGLDDLIGGAGNDLLDGGTGADAMAGGAGDDTYIVDDAGDTAAEDGGEGSDRVRATASVVLGDNLENLSLEGVGDIDGTGNGLDNVIDGNSGANGLGGGGGRDLIKGAAGDDVLEGGTGADHLLGGAGADQLDGADDNDRLDGGDGEDVILGGAGVDLLDGGADNDILAGGADADQLLGGTGTDTLDGGEGNDVLNGGTGADAMTGGLGDDGFFVDEAGDTTIEAAGEGIDQVRASISLTLADNIEILILQGAANLDGTGNGLANVLNGNSGDNVLDGTGGNDLLKGGLGADTLIGGTGGDILVGGGGADSFVVRQESVYSSLAPGGRSLEVDTASDYATGDRIDLSAIDAITGGADDAFALVGAFSNQAGEMTLTFTAGATTLALDTDGDGQPDYVMRINGDVTGDSGGWAL
ncbi:MAG TPA: hypothetical protein VEA44_11570 [Caulobacter sp.]|nr:hypothetical protein [Caulobacter sp.]